MKCYYIIVAAALIISVGSWSCGKSCGTLGWALGVQDELNNLSTTSAAYSQNPTTANCQAYREAYIDYIDALKKWDKCVGASDRGSWQQSLDEAETEAENIQC